MRKFLKRWASELARDDGVAGLIIAMIIMAVASSAVLIFLMINGPGPNRTLIELQGASRSGETVREAVMAYFNRHREVPCPDTDFDGAADSCPSSGTASGTLPWSTLEISRQDAADAYGRYYTYIVGPDGERAFCKTVNLDYGLSDAVTGEMNPFTQLEVRTTGATSGTFVPFAILSHGPNGLGGVRFGAEAATGTASGDELTNATANPAVIYTGPFSRSTPFDDTVYAPVRAKLQKICEKLSPGGAQNAELSDDFSTGTGNAVDGGKWDTSAPAPTRQAGYATFPANSYLATKVGAEVSGAVRPLYVSTLWTPVVTNNSLAIVTRATAGSTGTDGVSFVFGGTTIDITVDGATVTTPTAFTATGAVPYLIEAYDNGNDVWARATRVDNPSITATVRASAITGEFDGDNRVVFEARTGTSNLDDIFIGYSMLSLETRSAALGGLAYGHATAANGSSSGAVTVEAWVRPLQSLTSGTIVSQWDPSSTSTSSFRLFMQNGALYFDVTDSGGNSPSAPIPLNIILERNTWSHVAVSYSDVSLTATPAYRVLAYKNGEFASSTDPELALGLHSPSVPIGFGVDFGNSAPANAFTGQIADVRIWSDRRAGHEIGTCYGRRIGDAICPATNLVANWRMDPTRSDGVSGSAFATTAIPAWAGTAGTRVSATWTPTFAVYFRATSEDSCPSGSRSGIYQCDFRTAGAFTASPDSSSVPMVFAKAWGAGENERILLTADLDGEGGSYAGALFTNDGSFSVTVGAHGSGEGANGGDSIVLRGSQSMTAPGGETGGLLGDILTLVLNLLGGTIVDGGTPGAGNNGDPDYNLDGSTAPVDPGLGGEDDNNLLNVVDGHDGAVVLRW